jgi:hypothetical protein
LNYAESSRKRACPTENDSFPTPDDDLGDYITFFFYQGDAPIILANPDASMPPPGKEHQQDMLELAVDSLTSLYAGSVAAVAPPCKCHRQKKGQRATTNLQAHHISDSVSDHSDDATSNVDDNTDSIIDSYAIFGVKFGIGRYQYLRDRYAQRPDSRSDVKGTTTQCPTNPSECCFVKLVLKFHEFGDLDHGYIYLSCGFGSRLHKFHAKPDPGDLCQHKRHLSTASQKVLASSQKASIGSPSIQKLVIEHSNNYIFQYLARYYLGHKKGGKPRFSAPNSAKIISRQILKNKIMARLVAH